MYNCWCCFDDYCLYIGSCIKRGSILVLYLFVFWMYSIWLNIMFSDCFFCGNSLGMPAEVSLQWGWVMHICVSNLTIIGPDNVLSPGRCQAIIWTNVGILLIEPWGTNFSEISIEILTFSFKKMHLKVLFAKRQPSHLGINVLRQGWPV